MIEEEERSNSCHFMPGRISKCFAYGREFLFLVNILYKVVA